MKKNAPEGEEFETLNRERNVQVTPAGDIQHRIHLLTKLVLHDKTVEGDKRQDILALHEQFNGTTYKGNEDRIQTPHGDV